MDIDEGLSFYSVLLLYIFFDDELWHMSQNLMLFRES